MKEGEIERLVGYLLAQGTPLLTSYATRRGEKPTSQYYQEEIERIRRVVERMEGREQTGKGRPCPVENPAFAARVVREAFEETRKEIGGKHEMTEERKNEVIKKVKTKVMGKLGLNQKR